MIPAAEIRALEAEWQLREDVVEKDYTLGWVLAGIAAEPALRTWVFKGGTALRKCYYETYRFSEDLDFTIVDGGPETPEDLVPIFKRMGSWLYDRCGMELTVDDSSFRRKENKRKRPTTEGKLAYRGPRMPRNLPKLKLDLTSDEVVPSPTVAESRRGTPAGMSALFTAGRYDELLALVDSAPYKSRHDRKRVCAR